MAEPKYLILVYCEIEILFKNTLVCRKGLFNLGGIIRKLDLEGLTMSLLELNQIDRF